LPDFTKQFVVETDASDLGFWSMLMQEEHPLLILANLCATKIKHFLLMRKSVWL
jgi:hypothetical protein